MTENNRPDLDKPAFDPLNDQKNGENEALAQVNRAQAAPEIVADKTLKTDPTNTPGWERNTLEKLAFASLNEQKSTRRWKAFTRLAWLAFFIALVWMVMHRGTPTASTSTDRKSVV